MLPDFRSVLNATSAAGGAEIAMSIADGRATINSGTLQLAVHSGQDADEYPAAVSGLADERFRATFSHEQLRSLARIAKSISTEETRYYLNGIHLSHVGGMTYRAAATDGHRLSLITFELMDATGQLDGVILPRKAVRTILDIAGKRASPRDEGIVMRLGSAIHRNAVESLAPDKAGVTRAEFQLGSGSAKVTVTTKLIDGTYPDVMRVIPASPSVSMLFKSAELQRAVLAVSAGMKDVRAVRLTMHDDAVTIDSAMPTTTNITVRVPCSHDWKGNAALGFNGEYLLSMIEASGGEEFLLRTDDPASPAVLANPADTAWKGVLMPCRI